MRKIMLVVGKKKKNNNNNTNCNSKEEKRENISAALKAKKGIVFENHDAAVSTLLKSTLSCAQNRRKKE